MPLVQLLAVTVGLIVAAVPVNVGVTAVPVNEAVWAFPVNVGVTAVPLKVADNAFPVNVGVISFPVNVAATEIFPVGVSAVPVNDGWLDVADLIPVTTLVALPLVGNVPALHPLALPTLTAL